MIFREATPDDIHAIVGLLKLSLGEASSPKSAQYWTWKHVVNPFGPSPVFVAEDNGKLVGVRAFMRWSWTFHGEVFSTLRAVDTATHPDYRGRKIFSELTMKLVEQCSANGDQFIFNTPNKSSMPGYLKMGWHNLGKAQLLIHVPISSWIGKRRLSEEELQKVLHDFELRTHLSTLKALPREQPSADHLASSLPASYLDWRYLDCPVMRYYGYADKKNQVGYIFSIREHRFGRELRICEVFGRANTPVVVSHIKRTSRELKARVVTSGPQAFDSNVATILAGFIKIAGGPAITYKPLNNKLPLEFLALRNWHYTIGTMELF